MKKLIAMMMLSALVLTSTAIAQEKKAAATLMPGTYAVFETSMGNFTCQLFSREAPEAVSNFIGLAEGTKDYVNPKTHAKGKGPYYNGTIFHRVIDGFMIQGGDPTGTGMGEPGYTFRNETNPNLKHDREGRLAMANRGRDTNGSQFYVTLGPKPSLDGGYTIFGQVVDGMDVVKKIGKVPVKLQGGEMSRPVTDVILKKVTIQRVK